ncbi:MAG TPA: DUF2061 domain-containing protein [Chitinophagales bacterium]|nr:DUF2061 domain-containing protein [Chitinophagales bacterium]
MSKDKHHISFIKGVTWRIVGTLDTMMLSYIFTGSIGNALKIGITEVFTKIGLFYLHERIWFLIKWGTTLNETDETLIDSNIYDENKKAVLKETHTRSIVKGISWRIVGTIDTIIIAFFWTGDYTKALKIGFTEVITKVLLYYLHERIWMKLTRK